MSAMANDYKRRHSNGNIESTPIFINKVFEL